MATLKKTLQGGIGKTIKEEKSKAKAKKAEAEKKKEKKYAGVYYEEDKGTYGFRLTRKNKHYSHDTNRTGFATALQAQKARAELAYEWKHEVPKPDVGEKDYSKTFTEVFEHYMEHRSIEKREATTRKHKSIWNNHLKQQFGDKKLADVPKAELYNYLLQLYRKGDEYNGFKTGYAYGYVEGFLKLIWLIYGYAYDNNWVDPERYNKDFLNKNTKLSMPKKQEADKLPIEIYTKEEIEKIENVMKDGNLYISFLLCYLCGLRISECMGMMWKDFHKSSHTIEIKRQLLYSYEDKVFYIGPPKTEKGSRTVQVPDKLYDFLIEYKAKQDEAKKSKGYMNTEIVYDRMSVGEETKIIGGDFIQRKENGELITINSVKYWTSKVKSETGIDFHFHALRHTNASALAARGIPIITLADHLGHANINVCRDYYVTTDEEAKKRLINALNEL